MITHERDDYARKNKYLNDKINTGIYQQANDYKLKTFDLLGINRESMSKSVMQDAVNVQQ